MNLKERLALLAREGGLRSGSPTPVLSTTQRLQRLLERSVRHVSTRRTGDGDVARMLEGSAIAAGVIVVERFYSLDYVHGNAPVATLFEAPLEALNDGRPVQPGDLLLLDTETTGLAGGTGTLPFLLGLARPEPRGLRVRQYFLTGFRGEAAMLEHARSWFGEAGHLVTFNGKCFDVPLLATRYRLMRRAAPLDGKGHFDLLHPTRTAFGARWADCRLQTTERRLLGFVRVNDLDGHLIPSVWTEFVRLERVDDLPRVLEHNRWDLLSLAGLLSRLAAVFAEGGHEDADPRAVARYRLRRGDAAGALRELAGQRATLGVAGLLELAQLHRRRGDWGSAVPIWEGLAGQEVAEAQERLAKYHEHVRRDFTAALALTERLLARHGARPEHLRRRQRLLRRMADASVVHGLPCASR